MGLFSKKPPADVPRRRLSDTTDQADRYTFARNRTLTGSSSVHVSGVNDQGAQLQSPRTQAHYLARRRRHVGGLFLVVIATCAVLAVLLTQLISTVHVVAADHAVTLDGKYSKDIQSYFDRQPLERLRFMLNTKQLLAYLQSIDPEISDIQLTDATGYATAEFAVSLRHPILSWTIGSHRQYVDDSGVAFTHNYFAEPQVQVVDQSGIQVASGQTVASNRFLEFMGRIVGLASKDGYTVTQLVLPSGVTHEVDVHMQNVGYPVRFLVDRPAGEQVEDMDRAVRWLAAHQVTPKYLDVRVSRRAYYATS